MIDVIELTAAAISEAELRATEKAQALKTVVVEAEKTAKTLVQHAAQEAAILVQHAAQEAATVVKNAVTVARGVADTVVQTSVISATTQILKERLGTHRLVLHEQKRLKALTNLGWKQSKKAYEDIVRLASGVCGTPVSLITVITKEEQNVKASVGTDFKGSTREDSFCQYTLGLSKDDVLVVEDARLDQRFASSPLVVGPPYIRFYAGVPLITEDGFNVGALCVIDSQARILTEQQKQSLHVLRDHLATYLHSVKRPKWYQRWFPWLFASKVLFLAVVIGH